MKHIFFATLFMTSLSANALGRSGSCAMGSGENEVKMFITVEGSGAEISYEGSEDEKTTCTLLSQTNYDYAIGCISEEEEDSLSIRIKGQSGSMVDAGGDEIAKLKKCKIR